jgi:hypothetical protein
MNWYILVALLSVLNLVLQITIGTTLGIVLWGANVVIWSFNAYMYHKNSKD